MRAPAPALAAAALVALALPATADAKTFRGKTSQGRSASVKTGADGVPTRLKIAYRVKCGDGTGATGDTRFQQPLDAVTATSVTDGGTETVKTRTGTARITTKVTGTFANNRWSGTYKVSIKVRAGGKTVTTCRKKVTWKAK